VSRKEFTKETKREALRRSRDACEAIGPWYGLRPGQRCYSGLAYGVQFDHIDLGANSKVNSLENCAAVCVKCHAFKTRNHDIPKAAKTVRQQDKARGTKKPQRRPMPGSKASGLEKRMDGSVERRISLWPAGNNRDGD
jgi:hypothetical protein